MTIIDFSKISEDTIDHVTRLFAESHPVKHAFHNLAHTQQVVAHANEIGGHYELDDPELFVLFQAAWFHDTGYMFAAQHMHEEKSVEMMRVFLNKYEIERDVVEAIAACILATRSPRNPQSLLEEIICDADTYHFGTEDFFRCNKKVYREARYLDEHLSKEQFTTQTISMLQGHEFYTDYCRELLEEEKQKNMKKLMKKAEAKAAKKEKELREEAPVINEKQGTTKGMQTMLRLTSSNHIQLSEMADNKANILISVNAIIISVILSVLLRKLSTDPYLTIPTIIFLASSVATIVVAILATRPKLSLGTFAEEDVVNKKTNLLFFGNFHKMPQADYENAMRSMMKDPDYLYSSIVQDIYSLGAVLGKKYRLVRIAYNLFMFGIVISVVAFALASVLNIGAAPENLPNSTGSPF